MKMRETGLVLLGFLISFVVLSPGALGEEFTLYASPGWNLISVPLKDPEVVDTNCTLSKFAYTKGYMFELVNSCDGLDGCITDSYGRNWKLIKIADVLNNTVKLEAGKGYFVYFDVAKERVCYIKFRGEPFVIDTQHPYRLQPVYQGYAILGAPWVDGVVDNLQHKLGTTLDSVAGSCSDRILNGSFTMMSNKVVKEDLLYPGKGYIIPLVDNCSLDGNPVVVDTAQSPGVKHIYSTLYVVPGFVTRNRNHVIDSLTLVYTLYNVSSEYTYNVRCGFKDPRTNKVIYTDYVIHDINPDGTGIGLGAKPPTLTIQYARAKNLGCTDKNSCTVQFTLKFPEGILNARGISYSFEDGLYPVGCWIMFDGKYYALSVNQILVESKEECPFGIRAVSGISKDKDSYRIGEKVDLNYSLVVMVSNTSANFTGNELRGVCTVFTPQGNIAYKQSIRLQLGECKNFSLQNATSQNVSFYCAEHGMEIDGEKLNRSGVYEVICGVPWTYAGSYGVCGVASTFVTVAEKSQEDTKAPDFDEPVVKFSEKDINVTVKVHDENLLKLPYKDVESCVMMEYRCADVSGGDWVVGDSVPMRCTKEDPYSYSCSYNITLESAPGVEVLGCDLKFRAVDKYGNLGTARYWCNESYCYWVS